MVPGTWNEWAESWEQLRHSHEVDQEQDVGTRKENARRGKKDLANTRIGEE
jgi:hypothetical protein